MNIENRSAYRQVLKATSLFGGAQIFIILIGLVRSKIIALYLGADGFGVTSLLNTPLQLIATITGLGISFSAVREIAIAYEQREQERLDRIYSVFYKWLWVTGILGTLLVIMISPILSYWSFGNLTYTYAFLILSPTLLLLAFSNGQSAYLRGTRRLVDSAQSSVLGPLMGLILSLPLFIYLGMSAIIPALFLTAITTLFASWIFFRKARPNVVHMPLKTIFLEGMGMVKLGVVMTITGLITQLVSYIIIILVSSKGGTKEVGLYNAGYSITTQYVGIIFSAILVDYFPRLSAINKDNLKVREVVNQQSEITILLLVPLLLVFVILLPFIIQLLFTKEFVGIMSFVRLMAFGMFFRAISWGIAFVPSAKGDNKLFLILEFVGAIVNLLFSYIGYILYGLEGLGGSFILFYIFYWLLLYIVAYVKYGYMMSFSYLKIVVVQLLLLVVGSILIFLNYTSFVLVFIIFVASLSFSFYELNKRIDFKHLFNRKK